MSAPTPNFHATHGLVRLVAVATVVVLTASACGNSLSIRRHAAGGQIRSCSVTATPGSPVTISLSADISNVLTAPVCIDGQGPFHLLVDTGASATALDSSVTSRLHLTKAGPPRQFFGVGRPLEGQPVKVSRWNLGTLRLAPQVVYSERLGLSPHVDGLLGSDVLSRFGAIRLDYDQAQLIVARSEGPALSKQVIQGDAGHRLPAAFARYQPQAVLPLTVVDFDGAAVATAAVNIGPRTLHLEIDSGSDRSAIATSEAAGLGLTPEPGQVHVQGIGGSANATLERVGAWSLGSVRLVPEDLISVGLPSTSRDPGLDGLLGADVLSQFRAVTIDYTDATLAIDQIPVL
jgi:predicted aspartyl protease